MSGVVTSGDVAAALRRVHGHVRRTPVIAPGPRSFGVQCDLALKLECLQHTGSFKPRGAFNTVLAHDPMPDGIVAASGGNHGVAVAHVAHVLGIGAEVFVPEVCPTVKRERIAALGARVRIAGALYDDAQLAADAEAQRSGWPLVHPYDSVTTVAGQATCGVELVEQATGADVVVVAVGGGGFAAGIALACADHMRVVTVEPATSACLHAAFDTGGPATVEVRGLAADSLGARRVGDIPWGILADRVDQSVVVSDEDIALAQRAIWDEVRIVAEPGGATALAGVIAGAVSLSPDEQVAVIVCGANTDPASVVLAAGSAPPGAGP